MKNFMDSPLVFALALIGAWRVGHELGKLGKAVFDLVRPARSPIGSTISSRDRDELPVGLIGSNPSGVHEDCKCGSPGPHCSCAHWTRGES